MAYIIWDCSHPVVLRGLTRWYLYSDDYYDDYYDGDGYDNINCNETN